MPCIGVFCGSRAGVRPAYRQAAATLGRVLAARGIDLVYGGIDAGLMGVVADAALAAGGSVIGVVPVGLDEADHARAGLTARHEVATLADRKAVMAELADGFIALPGGIGTLDEVFEMLANRQVGAGGAPVGLLDVAGYWSDLTAWFDHAVAEGFVSGAGRSSLLRSDDPVELVDRLSRLVGP
ncbi:MAG: TIGR00730 family Rossman fold protein [Acidimicrobiales bacterium]